MIELLKLSEITIQDALYIGLHACERNKKNMKGNSKFFYQIINILTILIYKIIDMLTHARIKTTVIY